MGYPLNRNWKHRQDGRYKYLGGAIGPDGFCYFFPCDAERVLRVDIKTGECKTIGPKFMEGMNKWQNGFCASDGCIYAIPQRAHGVLKIEPSADRTKDAKVVSLDCGGGEYMKHQKDKFEAAVMAQNGEIFCIPLRAKQIVKIIPGKTQ